MHGKLKRHDYTQCIKIDKDTNPHCIGNSKDKLHTIHGKIINTQLNVALKNYKNNSTHCMGNSKDTTPQNAYETRIDKLRTVQGKLYTLQTHRKTVKTQLKTHRKLIKTQLHTMHRKTIKKGSRTEQNMCNISETSGGKFKTHKNELQWK